MTARANPMRDLIFTAMGPSTRSRAIGRAGRFLVAFGICGPLTAPAAICLMDCLRARRPVMASFYGASIAEWWLVLALLAQHFAGALHG